MHPSERRSVENDLGVGSHSKQMAAHAVPVCSIGNGVGAYMPAYIQKYCTQSNITHALSFNSAVSWSTSSNQLVDRLTGAGLTSYQVDTDNQYTTAATQHQRYIG